MTMENKQGLEHPQVIIYVLFVSVLVIAGVYVGFHYLGGVDLTFKFLDNEAKLNLATLKLFSPECYGLELAKYSYIVSGSDYIMMFASKYEDPSKNSHYQTALGILNLSKLKESSHFPDSCRIEEQGNIKILINLTSLEGTVLATAHSGIYPPTNWETFASRSFYVLVYEKEGFPLTPAKLVIGFKKEESTNKNPWELT
ncbi:MAG: hypothetical protein QW625_01670 [Candidatus Nanoarchaeia archaeon]